MELQQQIALLDANQSKLAHDKRVIANSLIHFYGSKGYLTEKQVPLFQRILVEACPDLRDKTGELTVANFSRITDLFDAAVNNGRKSVNLRLGDRENNISLSLAKSNSSNPGSIYVKLNGDYQGKISREGIFKAVGKPDPLLVKQLEELAIDAKGAMQSFGRRTGRCCICGKELTNKESIELGIGPICADGFGF